MPGAEQVSQDGGKGGVGGMTEVLYFVQELPPKTFTKDCWIGFTLKAVHVLLQLTTGTYGQHETTLKYWPHRKKTNL